MIEFQSDGCVHSHHSEVRVALASGGEMGAAVSLCFPPHLCQDACLVWYHTQMLVSIICWLIAQFQCPGASITLPLIQFY